jgi:PEP-CTERM motif
MKARLCAAALAAVMGVCAPASATIIDVIYKGSVINGSGTDDLGLFGPAGASLVGDAFVATFEMDTSKGTNASTATENYIFGGTVYGPGVDSPMLKATLEINGKTADVGTGLSDSVQSFLGQPGIANQQSHVASNGTNSILLDVMDANLASVGNIPFTIDVPLTFNFDSSDIGGGFATFGAGGTSSTSLSLGPTQLIYEFPSTDVPGTPEPSTWAMMLLGFAGLGYAGFKRRPRARLA